MQQGDQRGDRSAPNSQRQIGQAFLEFVDTNNVFPNAATYGEIPGVKTAAAVNGSIINFAFLNNSANFGTFIAANPAKGLLTDIGPLYSWVVDLLPYLDAQSLYNDYNRNRVYWDNGRAGDDPSASDQPDDRLDVAADPLPARRTRPCSRTRGTSPTWSMGASRAGTAFLTAGSAARLAAQPATPLTGRPLGVPEKTGMFFLGTMGGRTAWDNRRSSARSSTAASTTVMLSENCLAGASPGNAYSGKIVTNWATAHPNFVMFMASDNVCNNGLCTKTTGSDPHARND